jgi:hypothetical protein
MESKNFDIQSDGRLSHVSMKQNPDALYANRVPTTLKNSENSLQ